MPTIQYTDLEFAYGFVDAAMSDNAVYICRATGKMIYQSPDYMESDDWSDDEEEDDDSDEARPDVDYDDETRYCMVPNKDSLDLGSHLVRRFAEERMPDHQHEVYDIFRHRGAYRRFKDLLADLGKLEEWYKFEQAATEAALLAWAEEEGFTVEGVPRQPET
ncbi:MAG: hypothetical protein JNM43_07865 [Planctomycetaceae bacterium]|nr:hypothetical protein [Planctomycetaceae bacterium]